MEQTEEFASDALPKGSTKASELVLGNISVRVKTDATPAVLKQIREIVDRKHEELAEKASGALSTHQLALLVSYNLAEELLAEKAKLRKFKKEVVERSERLLNRVESHLDLANEKTR